MRLHIPTVSRNRLAVTAALATFLAATSQAQQDPREHHQGLIGEKPDASTWPHPAAPDANPFPRSNASPQELDRRNRKILLGKLLFWDEQVSTDDTMACGTCHIPTVGGTDGRLGAVSPDNGNFGAFGVIPQHRNTSTQKIDYGHLADVADPNHDRLITPLHTPTMIGAYVFERQFWDLRAGPDFEDENEVLIPGFSEWAGMEAQAVGPVANSTEMGHEGLAWSQSVIQKKLNVSRPLALVDPATIPPDIAAMITPGLNYKSLFDQVFVDDPQFGAPQGVTRERFGMAVAHYMRTLIPDQAPIDLGTMTKTERAGFDLMSVSGCFRCHSTSGDPQLKTAGGIFEDPFDAPMSDGEGHDIGFGDRFKAPTLRNLPLRKKFFSHGRGNNGVNTIDAIIQFYDDQPLGLGFEGSNNGKLTPQEFAQVKAFFENALTDPRVEAETFPFDRPELASERPDYNPFEGNEYGVGTPGPDSGLVPEIIANSVPRVYGPIFGGGGSIFAVKSPPSTFKIGVGNGQPVSPAILLVSTSASPIGPIWVGPNIGIGPVTTTNGAGIATVHKPFTLSPAIIGTSFFCQWTIKETSGPAHSNAAKFTPFMF